MEQLNYIQILKKPYTELLKKLIFDEYEEKNIEEYLIDVDWAIATCTLISNKIIEFQNIIEYIDLVTEQDNDYSDIDQNIKDLFQISNIIKKNFIYNKID